ncbi:type IV secretion system protein [Halomonas sp. 3D7M]|uniref:type IV secretion system protein n=1 Tax=Halomonas sp. 3D7M TaxID=2742617 RepID=UPI001866806D|nr:type IV secretion system protein [Halomonas sp. 3D7M]
MKKISRLVTGVCACLLSFSVHATGIPTFDASTFAQMTAQILETKRILENAKDQLESMTGNDNIGRMLYDSELFTYIPESGEWSDILDYDVSALAEKYELISDDPAKEEYYEKELTAMLAAERSYRAQTQRLANIEALMDRANVVDTPQQREDLANAIAIEQAAIQLEQNRMVALENTMVRDRELRESQAVKKIADIFSADPEP